MSEIQQISLLKEYRNPKETFSIADLKSRFSVTDQKVIILDDDPTGCQTIHDVIILTSYDEDILEELLRADINCFFILTNTRSLVEDQAVKLTIDLVKRVQEIAERLNLNVIFISRSDSTLRGHYPAELNAITEAIGAEKAMHCLIPAFFQGGRYTLNNIHYVLENEQLVPAHLTPFADDKSFGFSTAVLPEYVEEKTKGIITARQVLTFSIDQLRQYGTDYVSQQLLDSTHPVCVVNAIEQNDLNIFAVGARKAIKQGKQIAFRTAASFINSFCAIDQKDLLKKEDIVNDSQHGGLFIVGSYVPKSSLQLSHLMNNTNILKFELIAEKLITSDASEYLNSLADQVSEALKSGQHAVTYTSRELISGSTIVQNLEIGQKISDALVYLTKNICQVTAPGFVLTKGGITSHVIAKDALNIRKAMVTGQILPGVPVWEYNDSSLKSSLIIFPGNVGTETSLTDIYTKLTTD